MSTTNWDHVRIDMCLALAKRSTCWKKQTAAIIVDLHNRIISEGYNGTASKQPHCCDIGPRDRKEHRAWSLKHEIHAEINAIIWVGNNRKDLKGSTMYTVLSPCLGCAEIIWVVGIKRVVYKELYNEDGVRFLRACGIEVVSLEK